jgi:hypothetical protein
MDTKHFESLSKKWAHKLREDARDIEQEIIAFYCPGALKTRTWTFFNRAMKAHCLSY